MALCCRCEPTERSSEDAERTPKRATEELVNQQGELSRDIIGGEGGI